RRRFGANRKEIAGRVGRPALERRPGKEQRIDLGHGVTNFEDAVAEGRRAKADRSPWALGDRHVLLRSARSQELHRARRTVGVGEERLRAAREWETAHAAGEVERLGAALIESRVAHAAHHPCAVWTDEPRHAEPRPALRRRIWD